jgi:type IX secretion system PorP/SprF family membrane protein
MLKRIFKCSLVFCAAFFATKANAQIDPHFSQYYVYPQSLNPALTGVIGGDYRVAAVYRNQWGSIDNGFNTTAIAAEYATEKNINFGVGVFQQVAGSGGYHYITPYGSISYTGIKFGATGNHHINIGLNLGLIDRRFQPSKMQFGNQFNPGTGKYDSNLPSGEFIANASTSFDAGAGVLYFDATPNQKANVFLGVSFGHITQPADKFTNSSGDAKIPIRQTLHGGAKIALSQTVTLTPNFLLMDQGTAHEIMLGAYAQIKGGEGFDFLCGANYRFKDALVPFAGFLYKDFTLGLSYDVNTSDLGKIAGNANAFELSLSYTGKKRNKAIEQPFICPRL